MKLELYKHISTFFTFFFFSLLNQKISRAVMLSVNEFLDGTFSGSGPFFITYKTPREYRRLGKSVGLMLDIRVSLYFLE